MSYCILLLKDIDECALGIDNCNMRELCQVDGSIPCLRTGVCTNTDGSFQVNCQSGFTGDGHACTGMWLAVSVLSSYD